MTHDSKSNVGKSNVDDSNDPLKESHIRSFLKALSWRIVATCTTISIAYAITGETAAALTIGGIEFFLKFFIYYGHERLWQLAPRGSVRKLLTSDSTVEAVPKENG